MLIYVCVHDHSDYTTKLFSAKLLNFTLVHLAQPARKCKQLRPSMHDNCVVYEYVIFSRFELNK